MELYKHTMINSFKLLGKLYIWRQRSMFHILLFLVLSPVTIPLFIVTAVIYSLYYMMNYIYVYWSRLTKKILVKTRSTLLVIPFIIIGLILALHSIILYYITKGLSRLLQQLVIIIDIGRYLHKEEVIFFLGKLSRPTNMNPF